MENDDHICREGDVVLVHYQEKPASYARIETIEPDIKKGWYQVTFLLLTLPAQTVTWILRDEYINGGSFTMGGQPMRLEKVKRVFVKEKSEDIVTSSVEEGKGKMAKIIPFKNKKRE